MVYQMAQRGGECFLVRRVADRGIDKSIGDSRVRGDRLNYDRRSAGRGNEISHRDPRDIIKIEKLRKRVRDLEEIRRLRQRVRDLEEIRWLRQRVRDLELQREMRVKETESGTIVWDDENEEEEHPFCHPHPRILKPLGQDCLSEEEPIFDEDGIEPDEKECLLVREVLSGISAQGAEPIYEVLRGKNDIDRDLSMNTVAHGGDKILEAPLFRLSITKSKVLSPKYMEIQNRIDFKIGGKSIMDFIDKHPLNDKDVIMSPLHVGSTHGLQRYIGNFEKNIAMHVRNVPVQQSPSFIGPLKMYESISNLVTKTMNFLKVNNRGPHGFVDDNQSSQNKPKDGSCDSGVHHAKNRDGPHIDKNYGPRFEFIWSQTLVVHRMFEAEKSILNKRHSHAPFGPSSSGQELGETNRGVELFGWFVIIINKNRVDVPFDPGVFGPKSKLEDEFFSKRGSMMQEHAYLLFV
ncbi:hypothetical protein HanOQP8_Chr09g0318841 [Helianthus annuus]|nr:hypothetical protein HanOQP8_Chr09g0318841 [Helianthus annuus]